jgi:hypothetical protein
MVANVVGGIVVRDSAKFLDLLITADILRYGIRQENENCLFVLRGYKMLLLMKKVAVANVLQ